MAESESAPIRVYNLGEHGVNLVKSPLHLDDGELTQAQNAEFYREQGRGALRKRPALRRMNADVLAGTVGGIVGVPLPSVSERYVYVGGAGTSDGWLRYNGTVWSASPNQHTNVESRNVIPAFGGRALPTRVLKIGRQMYYMAMENSSELVGRGRVFAFDGDVEYEAFRMVHTSTGRSVLLCTSNDRVYASQFGRGVDGAVYEYNPATGGLRQIANTAIFTSLVNDPCVGCAYLGKLFVGTRGETTLPDPAVKIYAARPDDETWTLEDTLGTGFTMFTSMAVYQGVLYASTDALAGTNAVIRQRTPAGVWSTAKAETTGGGHWSTLHVFNDTLFASYVNTGVVEIYAFDGTTWTLDKDLYDAALSIRVESLVQLGTTLYVATVGVGNDPGKVWTRSTAGVWTDITGIVFSGHYGLLGVL